MKQVYYIFWLLILFSCKDGDPDPLPGQDNFIRGADLSFLPEIESYPLDFYDTSGIQKDVLTILKKAGCNTVRLRLWHSPPNGHSGSGEVADFARRIKTAGMKVFLTIHFSDTWADPGNQSPPTAWQGLSLPQLKDSVYQYVERVVGQIRPDYVSLGNEINGGMLWDTGRIGNGDQLFQLLGQAVAAGRQADPSLKIIIHYAGLEGSDWFFGLMNENHIDYDIIGLSYYPYWHGKQPDSLQSAVSRLSMLYGKPVLVAETAYPFTLGWNDWTNNIVGLDEQLIAGFPATPQGQLDYMLALRDRLEASTGSLGFCYWGGEWVAFKGFQATDGSSWENQALFDFGNKALPVLRAFRK